MYSKGALTEETLEHFVKSNLAVKPSDIVQLSSDMKDDDVTLFGKLLSICRMQCGEASANLNEAVDRCLVSGRTHFALCLMEGGAVPADPSSVSHAFELLLKRPETYEVVVRQATPQIRAEFLIRCLAAENERFLKITLGAGPIKSNAVDLSLVMMSHLIATNYYLITKLISSGASPDGLPSSLPPLKAVFKGTTLTRDLQARVACTLIENGADVKNLFGPYHDPMSPVHVATKLALETGLSCLVL